VGFGRILGFFTGILGGGVSVHECFGALLQGNISSVSKPCYQFFSLPFLPGWGVMVK
jgi:hypothetical protein